MGEAFTALLGAFEAQSAMQTPAIGGKDSMSGTFLDKDAAEYHLFCGCDGRQRTSYRPKSKATKACWCRCLCKKMTERLPCYEYAKRLFSLVFELIQDKKFFPRKRWD